MAQFIGKVFHYIFGELLVTTLANSKTFQRFAVKTDSVIKTHKATIKTHSERIIEHAAKKGETIVKTAKATATIPKASVGKKSEDPGFFGEFGRFMSHLGNEVKKDVKISK